MEPITSTTEHEGIQGPQELPPPAWTIPLIRLSDAIYAYFLALAILSMMLALSFLATGRTEFPWLPHVVSVLGFTLSIGFLALLVARHRSLLPGWVGIGLAALFHYGMPLALAFIAGRGQIGADDRYFISLVDLFKNLTVYLGAVSLLRLVIGYIIKFMMYQVEMRARRMRFFTQALPSKEKMSFIPKCWQLSRCRPGVRMTCPNYIDHVNCWKRRSGCFCDRSLANFLMQSVDGKEAQEIIDMQVASDSQQMQKQTLGGIRSHMKVSAKRSWRDQRKLCFECPLYIEHQEIKYRRLHWVSFPITAGITALIYPLFDTGYKIAMNWLATIMKTLVAHSSMAGRLNPDTNSLANSSFEYVMLGVFALILASYVIAVTEKALLQWKL